jgi:hypothetical protein
MWNCYSDQTKDFEVAENYPKTVFGNMAVNLLHNSLLLDAFLIFCKGDISGNVTGVGG